MSSPHGRAKFNQHGACLSEVLPVHVGYKQWFQVHTLSPRHELSVTTQRHAVDPAMGARIPHPTTTDGGSAGFAGAKTCHAGYGLWW
jgi:hypothetical protein